VVFVLIYYKKTREKLKYWVTCGCCREMNDTLEVYNKKWPIIDKSSNRILAMTPDLPERMPGINADITFLG